MKLSETHPVTAETLAFSEESINFIWIFNYEKDNIV